MTTLYSILDEDKYSAKLSKASGGI